MDKQKYFTKNAYGITIVKCCASCKHKLADSRVRFCLMGGGSVSASFLCKEWEMSEGLKNAGKGDGKVKKKEFLEHAISSYFKENTNAIEAANNNTFYLRVSKEEIQKEYEEMHGGIYYDL